MATTIRIDEDVKQQLKIHSAKVGVKQIDLVNRYVIDGIKNDKTQLKQSKSLEEIEKLLKYDKPEGNGLDKIDGLIELDEVVDPVQLKKDSYRS